MRRIILLILSLVGATSAQSLDGPLAKCGVRLKHSSALDRVATIYGVLGAIKPAAQQAGYAYQNIQGVRIMSPDLPAWLTKNCGVVEGTLEYGIAPMSDGRVAFVAADPKTPPGLVDEKQQGQLVLAHTNAARAKGATCGGVSYPPAPPLVWNDRLFAAAQVHARRLAELDFRGHVDPYDGTDPAARAKRAGYVGCVGENAGYGSNTAELVVRGWLESPGHCANLMNPVWREMGASVHTSDTSKYGVSWVQVFGAR